MSSVFPVTPASPPARASRSNPRHLYAALLGEHGSEPGTIDEVTRSASWVWLLARLDEAEQQSVDVPDDPRDLGVWLGEQHEATSAAYRRYLDERAAGAPRRYFPTRSHALGFLRAVAPTKLVDGAWLYGLTRRPSDARLAPLVQTYLEELGCGAAAQNHVAIYRALLSANGCDDWARHVDDEHYVQGAIQLALAHHADRLLPEAIGFNLGYEQLPLHLPITAYELNELDVDPYYFTLHVTIDNASTGHAQKALQCALDCLPNVGDRRAFHRRMMAGYKLNELGLGTTKAIAAFDLERALIDVLIEKAGVGAQLHSDYCRIGGRTIADWLSKPDEMPQMLATLASTGWIRRGAPVEESRFWRVLHDERGPMFGVFDGYASQLLRDWITDGRTEAAAARPKSPNRFTPRTAAATEAPLAATSVAATIADGFGRLTDAQRSDPDVDALSRRLTGVDARDDALSVLAGFLSPANHPTPAGLVATRLYTTLYRR